MIRSYLILLTFFCASLAKAQPSSILGADDLDYYLFQAFQAAGPNNRVRLNHIGVQVQRTDNGFLVTAAMEDYPAHRAGINRGDIIETAEGRPFHPVYSFNNAEDFNKGYSPVSNSYNLVVRRNQNRMNLTLRPVFENLYDSYRTATINSIQEFSAGNKVVGYVRFWALSRNSNDLVTYRNLINELDHCDGLIIDLRNGYGFLDLQHLDKIFPSRDSYFDITGFTDALSNLANPSSAVGTKQYRKPIAVLINSETRGGPELFAYQLGKLGRSIILGNRSPGKLGTYLESARDGTEILIYQPAESLLIDNNSIEGTGIETDRIVEYPFEQTSRGDPQYNAAMSALMGII